MDLFSQIEEPEREEIRALRKELEEANYRYYVLSQPTLSDREFDEKMRRLQEQQVQQARLLEVLDIVHRCGSRRIDSLGYTCDIQRTGGCHQHYMQQLTHLRQVADFYLLNHQHIYLQHHVHLFQQFRLEVTMFQKSRIVAVTQIVFEVFHRVEFVADAA